MHKTFPCGCYFEWVDGQAHIEPCSSDHRALIDVMTPREVV